MGKLRQFLTEWSALDTSVLSFQVFDLHKSQWIFTKLDMCIDIVEICLGLLMGKFRQFVNICPRHDNGGVLSFHVFITNI